MAEAARVGDLSEAGDGGDAVAAAGSPDVFFNGLAALRLDDGSPRFQAASGSSGVFINGKAAVRAGDATKHGDATGAMVTGSSDVELGDARPGVPIDRPHDRSVQLSFVDAIGRPVDDVTVEVFCPHKPLSTQVVAGNATISGLCSSATVTVHKALQAGEWDDAASQGGSSPVIMKAPLPNPGNTGGVAAPPETTVHVPGPSGTSPSKQTVPLPRPSNGGTTAVRYTTVHNWMELVYRCFGHHLPTGKSEVALLGMREASLKGPGRTSEKHIEQLEADAAAGHVNQVAFTREARSQSYNDLLFTARVDEHVRSKQHVDVYECTIDASPTQGKLKLPYILEGHMIHATPGKYKDFPGKHPALHLFHGKHEPHQKKETGGTVAGVLALARAQIPYYERSDGSSKYSDWYPMGPGAWCAVFMSWLFSHSGFDFRYTYCGDGAAAFQRGDWGSWHPSSSTAQPGDIVFYNWPWTTDPWDHTGVVVKDNGSTIDAIEGNTTDPSGVHGDGIYYKPNRPKSWIAGFGRPRYKQHTEDPAIPVIRWGGTGEHVKAKSERDSTLLHHPYYLKEHHKHVIDEHAKRYAHFIGSYAHAANKARIPYLVVSSRYVKTYAEWVKWVEANPGQPPARSVLRQAGLHRVEGHGFAGLYRPSFLSQKDIDEMCDHIHRMKDRHEAHELKDHLRHTLLDLNVEL